MRAVGMAASRSCCHLTYHPPDFGIRDQRGDFDPLIMELHTRHHGKQIADPQ